MTIEAAFTSQFERQVRALCGLPLGTTDLVMPAAMVNLLGDLWAQADGQPRWDAALRADPDVSLHLYGKRTPAPGRKMGHLTVLDPDPQTALDRVLEARLRLAPSTTGTLAIRRRCKLNTEHGKLSERSERQCNLPIPPGSG